MSGVISTMTYEPELNNIVKEYLEHCGYHSTSNVFDEECGEQGKEMPKKGKFARSTSALHNAQREILRSFKEGERDEFFRLWKESLPEQIQKDDTVAQKLEFYIHIYFAIYPVKNNSEDKEECNVAMQSFRQYLETKGASLSQTTEFLPFYALPYVPNPKTHPSYKDLFAQHWAPDLELRLNRYLQLVLESGTQPRLFELFRGASQRDSAGMQQMQAQIVEAERRTMQYMRRHNRVQADYHNLIGITAELVDALEACLSGKPISPEYLQQICSRLFASQQVNHRSMDFSRPGTAAEALRQSIKPQPRMGLEREDLMPPTRLDFEKIKADLQNSAERRKCFLLQALRWRLTKLGVEQRESNLTSYIANDLLGCSQAGPHRQAVLSMLASDDALLRQYSSRLFNTMASLCRGRTYLSQNNEALMALFENVKTEPVEGVTRENSIGALQKLSLRRPMQTAMIEVGVIEWLVLLLEDNDNLSDYTLEYSIALLMNLCLRTSGKKRCIPNAGKILKVLTDLLGHENKEVLPYVNGALYSILAIPSIRDEAKAMDMEGILKCFVKEDQPDMNRQLDFIIRQLNSTEEPTGPESDDEEDDDDEEDQDALEPDLDKEESIQATSDQETTGETLLTAEYTRPGTRGSRRSVAGVRPGPTPQAWAQEGQEEPLTRPVTPGQRAARPSIGGQSQPATDRPPTRSGSRPSTTQSRAGDEAATDQEENPEGDPKKVKPSNPEYQQAFSARPKIPRTPEPTSMMMRHSGGTPPKPTYSDGLPTPRPNSASRPPSAGKQSTTGTRQNGVSKKAV